MADIRLPQGLDGNSCATHGTAATNEYDRWISVTMEFRCNLRCTHCMIEGTMSSLRPTENADFADILRMQRQQELWDGIVLTGAEITLRSDLPQIAAAAREAGFRHIRVQTHGMQLHRSAYLDRLVDAGVDQFFISVTAADEERHDAITKVRGSWRRMRAGIDLIETRHPLVTVITNTVITAESVEDLPGIVAAFRDYRCIVQHEFWNFFPMEEVDSKSLCAPLSRVMPALRAAIACARRAGRRIEVKNIPECLLGEDREVLINRQPHLVIDPDFWAGFDRNGFHNCPHRASCPATECLGLTAGHLQRFPEEMTLLHPLPSTTQFPTQQSKK